MDQKKDIKAKAFLILIIVGIIFLGLVLKFINSNKHLANGPQKNILVTPTPFAYQEITIPYLRDRQYKSRLNNIVQIDSNSDYKKFLTSYSSDGFKINTLLTIPNTDTPIDGYPAIVFVHGFLNPVTYETDGQPYSTYVDYLARNGFVVLKIDLRGHGNSEGEPGGGYYGSDYVIDALNAYNALENADFVNPKKIGLWGHSMAGNILLRSLVIKKNIPATDIWAGAVYSYADRLKYGINDQSYRPPTTATGTIRRRNEIIQKYGDFSQSSEFWKQVAPTNYLNDIQGALQINHALDDDVVNIGYSRDLVKLLDQTKVVHEFNEYPSGGHNISGENFTKAMQNTVDFFNKYLK